jgi:acetylxylan esterase
MISTLFLAALAAAAPASVLESRQMPSCASGVYIISARGTFEPQGFGLQEIAVNAILNKIPGSNASAVVYPASPVDIDGSLTTGVANAQQQITDYRNACPESKIVLTGYSQGAQVIGDAIAGGGTGEPDGTDSPAATPISQTIGSNGRWRPHWRHSRSARYLICTPCSNRRDPFWRSQSC